jgi:serine/threonine protein phosphatase PrpC
MRLCAYGATHPGRVRDHNEDAMLLDDHNGVFVVADGMGGTNAGEVASSMVVDEVRRQARALSASLKDHGADPDQGRRWALHYLPQVIEQANRLVYEAGQRDQSCRGMGTTVVMLLPVGDEAYVCHVGDSRLYLLRKQELFQVTEDHSFVQKLVRQGRITPEEALDHPRKNLITRCIGIQPQVQVDSLYLDLQAGDSFLLCSDGLTDMLDDGQIHSLMLRHRGQALVDAAIDAANRAGGRDNITVLLLEVEPDTRQHPARMGMLERVEFLHDIFLFAQLNDQECVRVNRVLYELSMPARTQILRKGTDGDEFYIVVHGEVGIYDGRTHLTDIGPGGHFGEFSLLEDARRSADVWAKSDCTLLLIKRSDYLQLVDEDPVLGLKVYQAFLKHLADRVRDLSTRVIRS